MTGERCRLKTSGRGRTTSPVATRDETICDRYWSMSINQQAGGAAEILVALASLMCSLTLLVYKVSVVRPVALLVHNPAMLPVAGGTSRFRPGVASPPSRVLLRVNFRCLLPRHVSRRPWTLPLFLHLFALHTLGSSWHTASHIVIEKHVLATKRERGKCIYNVTGYKLPGPGTLRSQHPWGRRLALFPSPQKCHIMSPFCHCCLKNEWDIFRLNGEMNEWR